MKKIVFTAICAMLLAAAVLVLPSFALDEPKLQSDVKAYISFNTGDNANDGLSASTAKKTLLTLTSDGVVSLLKDGGTLVVSGKMFVGGNYVFPELTSTLLITSSDGTTDYKTALPENNPATALKMAKGVTLTFTSDTIIDDILLFQEYANSNTMIAANGCTLVIGEKVQTKGSPYSTEPCYMSLYAEAGSTLIVKAGTYQKISGEGNIVIADGVTVLENNAPQVVDAREAAANALYALGLVKGYDDSGSDFRLENSLSRAESIVQIVRFLGAEEKALTGNYTVPFADVPAWAVPYIGYAYANGITAGRSATAFDPDDTVDEAQFLTLLLRAMEYSDAKGDFVWSDPFAFANKVGLINDTAKAGSFSRGDAFMVCKNALVSKTKSGKTVADKLIAANVITEKAYGYAKRIADGETIVVACVGDSVTEGHSASVKSEYSYPAQLQKLLGQGFKVVNCGKSGAYVMRTDSAYNVKKDRADLWYPNTAAYQTFRTLSPDIMIVMLGTNDARSMTVSAAEEAFISSYKELIADLQSAAPDAEIYLSTMIPAPNADITHEGTVCTLPRLLRGIARDLGLPLIETGETLRDYYYVMLPYNDRVHPTDVSYGALAINFYNEVFGHSTALPELPKASSDVVYVSASGKLTNGGTSPSDAVDTLGLAVAMLREKGGTVVVCGPLETAELHLVACGGPVTVTSVYGGVDYRTKGAQLSVKGAVTLGSALVLENLTVNGAASGKSINCNYHDFTVGAGVSCIGSDISINVGYRVGSGAILPEEISCHADCTVQIESGKWWFIRGGNLRTSDGNPIGMVDKGVKVSIYIRGGEFTAIGANVNSASGMNSCDGEIYMEISGGKFAGSVYAVRSIGPNTTGTAASYSGAITLKITGGEFGGTVDAYQDASAPKATGTVTVIK
ncbi:MAG: S-layer homology domain-containing protein [Clostridia bacterium]|nr:S-layer homology domain-containing protein [Clostridia bacterium]